jgi:hypothetical protein
MRVDTDLLGRIPLGWKDLLGTNALAYLASDYEELKRLLTLTPGANFMKLFAVVIYRNSI